MPNWCEGSLKIRGTKENIRKFLEEGLNIYQQHVETDEDSDDPYAVHVTTYVPMEKDEWMKIYEDPSGLYDSFYFKRNGIYVEGTDRAFIRAVYSNVMSLEDYKEDPLMFVVRQAWDFRTEDWG